MKRLLLALFLFASPAFAQQSVQIPATMFSTPISFGTTTASAIVAGIAGKQIYVTSLVQVPASGAVVTWEYGTAGTNCTTPTVLTGAMTMTTSQEITFGTGNGAIMVVPQGASLCVIISTAAAPGWLTFSQY